MSDHVFKMHLTPSGMMSSVLLDGKEINTLITGVCVESTIDEGTRVHLMPAHAAVAELEVTLPEAQISIELPGAEVERIRLARPGPDDVIVIECAQEISERQADFIRDGVGRHFPDMKVLVLGDGMQFKFVAGQADKGNGNPPPPAEDVGGIQKKGI